MAMLRSGTSSLALLCAASAVVFTAPLGRDTPRRPVVMISIDGLRPDYVLEADRHGLRIPTLRRILRDGAHATGVRGVTPTVTYPSHTTLVTGVAPARHGILNNATFDPLGKNAGGWYWYASDIRVPTLWDAAAAAGIRSASVNWPVTVGARITWDIPEYWRTSSDDDRKLLRALATPGLLPGLERRLGPYPAGADGSVEADRLRGRFAARLLETRRPGLMLVHLLSLDHEEHTSGPFSPASLAALEALDSVVDTIATAAARSAGRPVVVAIVSDHGFLPVTREVHLATALRAGGLMTFASDTARYPSDWTAAPWTANGSAAVVLRDSASAAVRGRVGRLLDSLARDSANGIASVIDGDSLRTLGGFPGASWLVSLREGFATGSRTRGPLVTPGAQRGAHGFPADLPAMRAAFFIAGPGIPAGRSLGEIDMRDVAPTVAGLLGARLVRAEGSDQLPR
jgi:predicted AlkP superfamily pyrophosphatase or phosphodiesterase